MENFMEWKMMGVRKRMKKDVVPHMFSCHLDRERTSESPCNTSVSKLRRLETSQQASPDIPHTFNKVQVLGVQQYDVNNIPSTSKENQIVDIQRPARDIEEKKYLSIGVQAYLRPKYRSKSIQCEISPTMVCHSCSPIRELNVAISPSRQLPTCTTTTTCKKIFSSETNISTESNVLESGSDKISSTSSTDSELEEVEKSEHVKTLVNQTFYKIHNNPRHYLGIMKESMFLIKLLQEFTSLDTRNIYLTLLKIRLDKTFSELGDDFGVSESTASRIFSKSVGFISEALQDFIRWTPRATVKRCLPIPFRARYSKVYAIIDCLEIEIQKPEDPVKQALTWSEYKKANTIKYLLSSTPDGVINFISTGFGGRTSDTVIVENSGFLDKLQPNMHIMADRGFKHIDQMLLEKQCVLVRPPSVESGKKLTKSEVLETKKIASLRIHVERVIRRLREFKILRPHACLHNNLIPCLDLVMNIAGGLVNIQGPIIKGY